jgi:hypothetical protein
MNGHIQIAALDDLYAVLALQERIDSHSNT